MRHNRGTFNPRFANILRGGENTQQYLVPASPMMAAIWYSSVQVELEDNNTLFVGCQLGHPMGVFWNCSAIDNVAVNHPPCGSDDSHILSLQRYESSPEHHLCLTERVPPRPTPNLVVSE